MTIFALVVMIIIGAVIAVVGGYSYHRQKKKEKVSGTNTKTRVPAVGSAYLMSFGGILVILGITFLLEVIK